jgi:hypothetical protein
VYSLIFPGVQLPHRRPNPHLTTRQIILQGVDDSVFDWASNAASEHLDDDE